jgi:hypothetical protein
VDPETKIRREKKRLTRGRGALRQPAAASLLNQKQEILVPKHHTRLGKSFIRFGINHLLRIIVTLSPSVLKQLLGGSGFPTLGNSLGQRKSFLPNKTKVEV